MQSVVYKTAFYFSQLPGREYRDLYLQVLKCVREGRTIAKLEKTNLTTDQVVQVLYALEYDYPELFYVQLFGDGCKIVKYSDGKLEMHFRYLFPPREQQQKIKEIKDFIGYIASHISPRVKQSKYQTVLWLHDILCKNLTYNHAAIEKGAEIPEAYSIVGGMRDKTAVCAGVTKLFQMLCEHEGIWCTYVAGVTHLTEEELKKNVEGSTGRHAWNLVCIDNVYAYFDITWDMKEEKTHIPHTYFGMSSEECFRTRSPDQTYSSIHLPKCIENNPMNYYKNQKTRFRSFRELETYVSRCIKLKKKELSFQIDPQGLERMEISRRTQEFMSNYLNKKAGCLKQWQWTYSDTMMTFDYLLTYR